MELKYSNKDFFEEKEEIRAYFCSVPEKKNIHSHPFWELAYVYEGTALLHTEDTVRELNAGSFVLLCPNTVHSFTLPQENRRVSLWLCDCIFTQEYFNPIMNAYFQISELAGYLLYKLLRNNDTFVITLSDDNAQNVRHLLWTIAHEYNHYTAGSDLIIRQSLLNLFIYITRMYEYTTTGLSKVVSKSHEIDELAKYIRCHFSCKLTLDFLAQHMHLSREYLSRYFKKHMGKTISEYLLEVRIEKAKQMLLTSTHSVGDIGQYCGYSSISNFQKAFKKVTGVSPSLYRRQHLS